MKSLLPTGFLWVFALGLHAQPDSIALRFANTISQHELRQHLEVLASDSFLGRDTGKEGQKMAAAYLRQQFMSYGVPPLNHEQVEQGYYQPYELIEERNGSIAVKLKRGELSFPEEVIYTNETLTGVHEVRELTLLHAGDLNKGNRISTSGKHALLLLEDDGVLAGLRGVVESAGALGVEVALVPLSDKAFGLLQGFVHADGSRMRLVDESDSSERRAGNTGPQVLFVPQATVGRILGSRRAKRCRELRSGVRLRTRLRLEGVPRRTRVTAENVLAYIEGGDRKEEVVVITAHYDHIGVDHGVVYNGADDDGSGTVALLEIAQALMQAKSSGHGPRRSILIMPVSGEEKGLLGSRYYSDNPVFPIEATVANLNIDMIGRVDSAHAGAAPYVYIIGSDRLSSDLHAVNEQANQGRLDLDYTFNAEDDPNRFYFRSDHYNFARKGIPSIFYFSGVHEDYHQPGDDVGKIRFDLLEQRTRLVFFTAWQLANREERIRVDKPMR